MIFNRRNILAAPGALLFAGCMREPPKITAITPSPGVPFGSVEQFDPRLASIIDPSAQLTKLADGFWWSEGPVWDAKRNMLYFSDVPQNKIFAFSPSSGLSVFMDPSGLPKDQDSAPFDGAGTNGLKMGRDGALLVASHGKRALTRIDIDTKAETIVSDRYLGKKFNSPNDLIEASDGTIYFTDPPYGLKGQDASPFKEQPVNGVYRRSPDGSLSLIDGSLRRPNGIALSPDQRTLYVANSDRDRQILKSYRVAADGSITNKGVFFDAMLLAGPNAPGLPDGLCVDKKGIIFATGPGGVLILSPKGKLIGRINTGKACANCCLGNDGSRLYMTASDAVFSVPLKR